MRITSCRAAGREAGLMAVVGEEEAISRATRVVGSGTGDLFALAAIRVGADAGVDEYDAGFAAGTGEAGEIFEVAGRPWEFGSASGRLHGRRHDLLDDHVRGRTLHRIARHRRTAAAAQVAGRPIFLCCIRRCSLAPCRP